MGVWDILRFGLRRGGENRDPSLARLAADICGNLRGLDLHVESTAYGSAFHEIRASTDRRMITVPGGEEASGIALLLAGGYEPPALVFEQINSLQPGLGSGMVGAVLDGLQAHPEVIRRVRVNDLSPRMKDGRRWWAHVADAYPAFDWLITNDPDSTHWPKLQQAADARLPAPVAEIAAAPDFRTRQERLKALAQAFGHDPDKVTLSPEKKTFDYLGQSFTSEGEALPDGRVTIYYDAEMSDARLGCCLAHELQHVRYFAVRDAWRAEPPDGPLHRRFAKFTPELLAAQRGVSNYSNEHWDAWKGDTLPRLFSMELEEGQSEPINETIAEVAKALYNWGPDVRINALWRELREAIDEEYRALVARRDQRSTPIRRSSGSISK